jgi:hypothetical protein
MLGPSNSTSYLDLDQAAVSGALSVGTGVVHGTPVEIYQISKTPSQEADVSGLTPQV